MSEKDKESLIKKEKSRLRKVFSEIDPNKLKIIKPLIERAAFMTVSCEELEKITRPRARAWRRRARP